ncbi:hypothetical protein F4553_003638 [Allocatelliglobosispora scoriae]|uniref:Uncharacterized protein n=1 Tax=Allocatelliglobosispora scoriae TaxID=643052 RepID=A0A841BSV1_9ACTN|nr:hypothetical protein [Allocatelliglobosispora scoriae]MBB5870259.1 hypothetical protein [Allocatelliglobosispora scoriae]
MAVRARTAEDTASPKWIVADDTDPLQFAAGVFGAQATDTSGTMCPAGRAGSNPVVERKPDVAKLADAHGDKPVADLDLEHAPQTPRRPAVR